MSLKVLAIGFVAQPKSYLRNGWNILDFMVVVISIISMFFLSGNSPLASLKALRSLRALRPLRMINRAPGLKVVVNALFAAVPDVVNVAAVCLLFFLIFSLVLVNYMKGLLRACQGDVF